MLFSPTSLFNSVTSSFPWLVPFSSVWQFQHELAPFNKSEMIKSVPINCFSMLDSSLHLYPLPPPPLCFDALVAMAQALQSILGWIWDVHLVFFCIPLSAHWGFLLHPGLWHFAFAFFPSCDRNEVWTRNFLQWGSRPQTIQVNSETGLQQLLHEHPEGEVWIVCIVLLYMTFSPRTHYVALGKYLTAYIEI